MTQWGRGADRVVVGRGQQVLDHFDTGLDRTSFPPSGDWVVVLGMDGTERRIVPIGDPPLGEISYHFISGDCPYIAWTAAGLTFGVAERYAARF